MTNREKIEDLERRMKSLEERRHRILDAIHSVLQQPRVAKRAMELMMQGYSGADKWPVLEREFGVSDQRKEEERLMEEWSMLLKEKSALEKTEREEKERLEREAVARQQAEKEEKELLELEAAALKKAEAEKREKERFEQATSNPVSQRLYDVILAFDKFVASFQDRLGQNEDAKRRSDTTFEEEKKAEKKRFDDEENSIDGHLRRSIATIDGDIEEKRRELNRAIADIDRDVESYRDRGIAAIDNDLREVTSQINGKISSIVGTIITLDQQKASFDKETNLGCSGCSGGCLGLVLLPLLFGAIFGVSMPFNNPYIDYWWVGALVGALLTMFAPYLYFVARKGERESAKENLKSKLDTYTSQKEREKEEFIRTQYEPYKTKREPEKEKFRKEFSKYEALKKRERDELPSKLRCEDKIREAKSQYDNQINVINRKREENMAELVLQRQVILADFSKQLSDVVQPLSAVCQEIHRTQPLLEKLTQFHLNRTTSIPEFLALGQSHISFPLPEGFQAREWSRDVPHLLSFPFSKPLYGQCGADPDVLGDDLIRDLLMRLLFTMPVGSLQITAINPQRGTTLDLFNTLTDIKKLVPAGKWLTLSEDFIKPLREHYDYVEDCKRQLFRNGINNWMEYNVRNPEHPLPYKVLFIFGFPDQFLDGSIIQLKGILEEGIRCGILPIITIDDSKIDPQRQPKAAEIRDWLRKNAESIHSTYKPKLERLNMTAERSEPPVTLERVQEYLQWIHAAYNEIDK